MDGGTIRMRWKRKSKGKRGGRDGLIEKEGKRRRERKKKKKNGREGDKEWSKGGRKIVRME